MHTLVVLLLAIVATVAPLVAGHGILIEPPSRASAWRFGFDTPPNYDDNALSCGGFSVGLQIIIVIIIIINTTIIIINTTTIIIIINIICINMIIIITIINPTIIIINTSSSSVSI